MQRLIEVGCACGGMLPLKVILLARNRVISSVSTLTDKKLNLKTVHIGGDKNDN
jgi:hypothetical protein